MELRTAQELAAEVAGSPWCRQMAETGLWMIDQGLLLETQRRVALVYEPHVPVPVLIRHAGQAMPILTVNLNDRKVEGQEEIHDVSANPLLALEEQSPPLQFPADYPLDGGVFASHVLTRCYGDAGARVAAEPPGIQLDPRRPASKLLAAYFARPCCHGPAGLTTLIAAEPPAAGVGALHLEGCSALSAYLGDPLPSAEGRTSWAAIGARAMSKARAQHRERNTADLADALDPGCFHEHHSSTITEERN